MKHITLIYLLFLSLSCGQLYAVDDVQNSLELMQQQLHKLRMALEGKAPEVQPEPEEVQEAIALTDPKVLGFDSNQIMTEGQPPLPEEASAAAVAATDAIYDVMTQKEDEKTQKQFDDRDPADPVMGE